MRDVVHEMRNQLAVATANIEAFLDGKLDATPQGLHGVLQALTELDVLMNDLTRMRVAEEARFPQRGASEIRAARHGHDDAADRCVRLDPQRGHRYGGDRPG